MRVSVSARGRNQVGDERRVVQDLHVEFDGVLRRTEGEECHFSQLVYMTTRE